MKNDFLAKNLVFLRNLNGYSFREVSQELSITKSNVESYEKGIIVPPEEVTEKFASYYDVSKSALCETDMREEMRREN